MTVKVFKCTSKDGSQLEVDFNCEDRCYISSDDIVMFNSPELRELATHLNEVANTIDGGQATSSQLTLTELKRRLDDQSKLTSFTSDHEAGYACGYQACLESIIELMEEVK